jgi:hypothetical protein
MYHRRTSVNKAVFRENLRTIDTRPLGELADRTSSEVSTSGKLPDRAPRVRRAGFAEAFRRWSTKSVVSRPDARR